MNSSRIFALSFVLLSSGVITAEAAGFTAGNLVVVRVGDGSAALSSAATPVFLQEYTPSGSPVQTIALPTSVTGNNAPLTASGTATSEGFLKLSADGEHLTIGGYAAAVGTASVASTTSASVNRIVAIINSSGVVNTTTALSDAYSGGNIRGAVSSDGTQVWTGGSTGGIRYATAGSTSSTQLVGQSGNLPSNVRCVNIFGGQLYLSAASGTFVSVTTVGTGLPTSQTVATSLPGLPVTAGPSPYDFCLLDLSPSVPGEDTLYIADDRASASGGGIQKWTFDGAAWTLQYILGNAPCRGLTCTLAPNGTNVILYATTASASANSLISVTDTGSNAVATIIATGAANTVFRGVAFAPASAVVQPPSLAIAQSAGNVVISWPSSSTGWTLQFNGDLTTTNWSNSSATISDDGTNKSALVTPAGKQFYRLIH